MIQGTEIHSLSSVCCWHAEKGAVGMDISKSHGPLPAIISVTFPNSEPSLVTGWLKKTVYFTFHPENLVSLKGRRKGRKV